MLLSETRILEPPPGFEPGTYCLQKRCSLFVQSFEPEARFELATYCLQNSCSTTELLRLKTLATKSNPEINYAVINEGLYR